MSRPNKGDKELTRLITGDSHLSVILSKIRCMPVRELRIMVIYLAASIAMSALAFSDASQGERKAVVTGRVVDSLGHPIAAAMAVLVPRQPETREGPIEYHETDSTARFQVDATGPIQNWTLYLISRRLSNTHTTIAPPFSRDLCND